MVTAINICQDGSSHVIHLFIAPLILLFKAPHCMPLTTMYLSPPPPPPQIAAIKVAVPNMTCKVVDRAIQIFGAQGLSQDSILGHMYAGARSLRIADGPDAVHLETIAKEVFKSRAKL